MNFIVFKSKTSDVSIQKNKIDSENDLPSKKARAMHNVAILITSVFNQNHNLYYYKQSFRKTFTQMI